MLLLLLEASRSTSFLGSGQAGSVLLALFIPYCRGRVIVGPVQDPAKQGTRKQIQAVVRCDTLSAPLHATFYPSDSRASRLAPPKAFVVGIVGFSLCPETALANGRPLFEAFARPGSAFSPGLPPQRTATALPECGCTRGDISVGALRWRPPLPPATEADVDGNAQQPMENFLANSGRWTRRP